LAKRLAFLRDMSLRGEAVEAVCSPQRVNYEIFGNADPFLHAHVLPRYAWFLSKLEHRTRRRAR
jgi:diadenosine tetraphosphate (Ap4A) HIT family hydrolase